MTIILVGAYEIRVRCGDISRQRVHQITKRPGFPEPLATLAQGRVWLADDVAAWMKIHRPEPG